MATLFQVVMTLILLWTGSFESIVLYASVGLSIFSMLAMSSIFILRRKRPDLPRPFRTPGYPVTPAVYLILTSMLTTAAFWQRPVVSAAALGSILLGIPFYYFWRRGGPSAHPQAPTPVQARSCDPASTASLDAGGRIPTLNRRMVCHTWPEYRHPMP